MSKNDTLYSTMIRQGKETLWVDVFKRPKGQTHVRIRHTRPNGKGPIETVGTIVIEDAYTVGSLIRALQEASLAMEQS